MIFKDKSKSTPIAKEQVREAFKLVKSKGGSAGVDDLTIDDVAKKNREALKEIGKRFCLYLSTLARWIYALDLITKSRMNREFHVRFC